MNSTICQSSLISCPRSWRTPCRYSFSPGGAAASQRAIPPSGVPSALLPRLFPVLSVRQLQPFALQRLLFSDAAVLCQKAVCQAVAAPRLTTAHQLPDRLTTADQPPDRLTTADQPPDRLWVSAEFSTLFFFSSIIRIPPRFFFRDFFPASFLLPASEFPPKSESP